MSQEYSLSASAGADGSATVTFAGLVPTGLIWVIGQVSAETIPARSGATVTIRKNGRYVTSSPLGSGATAQGPPNIYQRSHDVVTVSWANLTSGDSCIATLVYSEYTVGQDAALLGGLI